MRALHLLLASALLAVAQEPARVGVGVVEKKLSLQDTLEMALRNNLDIEIERTSIANASQLVNAARGAFDGIFRWQPGYEHRNTPTTNVLFAPDGKLAEGFHNQNFAYLQRLNWQGSSVQLSFDNGRQSTNNSFVGLNPYVTSRLVLGYTQPLWRNRLIDRERAEIRIRSKQVDISQADLQARVIDVVSRVEIAYWDMVGARQAVRVAADGVGWAQEQLARNKRMIDAGTLARVELAAAEAELERRKDTYLASLGLVTEMENQLKTLIAASREDEIWNDVIIPTDDRAVELTAADDVPAVVRQALAQRPELKQLALRRESNEVSKALAADQLKPQVNLVAAYVNSGLAGTVPVGSGLNPFAQSTALSTQRINELSARAGLAPLPQISFGSLPQSLVGGYGSALSGLFGGNYPSVQVGVTMDWNTRNQTAKANSAIAAITEKRINLERMRVEQAIAAQVRNALQGLQTARQRIVAAEASAAAAKEKLDSETRLFQVGESTNFLVLTRQNEYTDSLRRVVVSKLDFNKSAARLQQATGGTLEAHKLTIR